MAITLNERRVLLWHESAANNVDQFACESQCFFRILFLRVRRVRR